MEISIPTPKGHKAENFFHQLNLKTQRVGVVTQEIFKEEVHIIIFWKPTQCNAKVPDSKLIIDPEYIASRNITNIIIVHSQVQFIA